MDNYLFFCVIVISVKTFLGAVAVLYADVIPAHCHVLGEALNIMFWQHKQVLISGSQVWGIKRMDDGVPGVPKFKGLQRWHVGRAMLWRMLMALSNIPLLRIWLPSKVFFNHNMFNVPSRTWQRSGMNWTNKNCHSTYKNGPTEMEIIWQNSVSFKIRL